MGYKYRKVSDHVVKTRQCDECLATVVGVTDMGMVIWLDVTLVTGEMEVVYHKVGRRTYHAVPRAGRVVEIIWRPPYVGGALPARGFILAEHPHKSSNSKKLPDPAWVLGDYKITLAPVDEKEMLF